MRETPVELDGDVHRRLCLARRRDDDQRFLRAELEFVEDGCAQALDFLDRLVESQAVGADDVGEVRQRICEQRMEAGQRAHAHAQLLDGDARVTVGVDVDESAVLEGVGELGGDLSQGGLLRHDAVANEVQLLGECQSHGEAPSEDRRNGPRAARGRARAGLRI